MDRRTSLVIPTERRVVSGAKAAAVVHHNGRESVHVTVGIQLGTAILLHIQLSSKLHVDRYLATITPPRPPEQSQPTTARLNRRHLENLERVNIKLY